jgi:hypothetical protein
MVTKTIEDSRYIMYNELLIKRKIKIILELTIMVQVIKKGPPNTTKATVDHSDRRKRRLIRPETA